MLLAALPISDASPPIGVEPGAPAALPAVGAPLPCPGFNPCYGVAHVSPDVYPKNLLSYVIVVRAVKNMDRPVLIYITERTGLSHLER